MKQFLTLWSLALVVTSGAASPVWAQTDVRRAGSGERAEAAQGTRTVSGTVLDEAGQPLIGATVTAVEASSGRTLKGGYTDAAGRFAFEVPAGTAIRIRVSYVGYADRIINLSDNQNTVSVTMAESSSVFDEVQITGFDSRVKRDNVGASAQVGGDKLQNVPVASFTNALPGRIPGLQVTQSNGIPGSATRIRGRGQNSIGSSSQPLVIVDGVPVFNQDPSDRSFGENPTTATNYDPLSTIPASDIESVTFLQDGYSTALYGSRAANGVLLVTTKSGRSGKTAFNASYSIGVVNPTRILPLLTGPEWTALRGELYSAQNAGAPMPGSFDVHPNGDINITASQAAQTNTNWFDYLMRQGTVQDFNLTASGGTEKTTFYAGMNYHQNEGFLAGALYRRFGVRFNIENQATDRVKIGARFGVNREQNNQVRESFNGGIGNVFRGDALNIMPVYNANGSYFGSQFTNPNTVGANPVAILNGSRYLTTQLRLNTTLYTDIRLIKDNKLDWRTEFGVDANTGTNLNTIDGSIRYVQQQVITMGGSPTATGPFFQSGNFSERRYEWFNWNFKSFLTWRPMQTQDQNLTVVGGIEATASRNAFSTIYTNGNAGFIDPYFTNFQGALNANLTGSPVFVPVMGGYNGDLDRRTSFLSFLLKADYTWRERYLFGAVVRADASSRFGPNNRWGIFPGLALGWKISSDPNINLPDWVTFLKLRASFGTNGNAEFGNFLFLSTYSFSGTYRGQGGLAPGPFESPNLKWERTLKYNVGLDFELWSSRLSGTIDFWYQQSDDLILVQRVPASSGGDQITINNRDVVVRNAGIDIGLQGTIIVAPTRNDFGWKATATLGFLDNKLLSTDGIGPDGFIQSEGDARLVQGQPVGVAYLVRHAYVDPATGDEYFYDLNGNAVRGPMNNTILQNRQPAGNPFPWLQGGVENIISWKGFDLSLLFTFQVGNTIYDDGAKYMIGDIAGSNQRREILDRWTTPGQVTSVPRLGFINDFNANNSTRFLYDADFLRLRQATLGYTFSDQVCTKLKLTSLRVYVTGVNLFVFTRFPGSDPEVVRYAVNSNFNTRTQDANVSFAAPYLATPQARTVSFGVNIGF